MKHGMIVSSWAAVILMFSGKAKNISIATFTDIKEYIQIEINQ